jgi:hypothetical protein
MSNLEEDYTFWKEVAARRRERILESKKTKDKLVDRIKELKDENERHKQALEFYANKRVYDVDIVQHLDVTYVDGEIMDDSGETARKAIEEDES